MPRLLLTLAATTTIAIAGCGSDDSSSSGTVTNGGSDTSASSPRGSSGSTGGSGGSSTSSAATPPPTPAATNSGSLPTEVARVSIQDSALDPKSLTVKQGQKILWQNDDPFDHDVTADKGASFKSGTLKPGETYTFTPKTTGTISYRSKRQSGVTGTIVVK